LQVKHIKDGSEILVTSKELAIYVIATMADWADQVRTWKPENITFSGQDGKILWLEIKTHRCGWKKRLSKLVNQVFWLLLPPSNGAEVLWPGESKPGLWMAFVRKLGNLLVTSQLDKDIVLPPIYDSLNGTYQGPCGCHYHFFDKSRDSKLSR
jgi:hypothetical protein